MRQGGGLRGAPNQGVYLRSSAWDGTQSEFSYRRVFWCLGWCVRNKLVCMCDDVVVVPATAFVTATCITNAATQLCYTSYSCVLRAVVF